MLICVEGIGGIGKTTLIQNSDYKNLYYHYPFVDNSKLKFFKNKKALMGMTMGKDLDIIQFHKSRPKINTIIDRSFLSTLVYGELLNRAKPKHLEDYFNKIQYELHNNPTVVIIYVYSYDYQKPKDRKDGYDRWRTDETKENYLHYVSLLKENCPHTTTTFMNNYNETSIRDFNFLLETLIEYQ